MPITQSSQPESPSTGWRGCLGTVTSPRESPASAFDVQGLITSQARSCPVLESYKHEVTLLPQGRLINSQPEGAQCFEDQGERREKESPIFHSPPKYIPCTHGTTMRQGTPVPVAMSLPAAPHCGCDSLCLQIRQQAPRRLSGDLAVQPSSADTPTRKPHTS